MFFPCLHFLPSSTTAVRDALFLASNTLRSNNALHPCLDMELDGEEEGGRERSAGVQLET
eukprot:765891-Hanusia_phi.AAC.1